MNKVWVVIGIILTLLSPWPVSAEDGPFVENTVTFEVDSVVVFERVLESNESAFSFLKPAGWQIRGGITRDPTALGTQVEIPASKLDLALARDDSGTALIHWLPNTFYWDLNRSPSGGTEVFPAGSTYQGMLVYPRPKAADYILQMLIPQLHPAIANLQIIDQRELPDLARQYQKRIRQLVRGSTFSYEAATVTVSYDQNGITYLERWLTVIEDWGEMGAGQWGNKETMCFRAPIEEFTRLEPVFGVIQSSFATNPHWLAMELGVTVEGEVSLGTRAESAAADRLLTEHRRLTNEQVHAHVFLALADQQNFLNPFTGTVESGSNRWPFRWLNDRGTIIYTTRPDYDPNQDARLQKTGFQRSEAVLQTGSDIRFE